MTPHIIKHSSSSEQIDNTPIYQKFNVGRRLVFQSSGQVPPQLRSNINLYYNIGENRAINKIKKTKKSTMRLFSEPVTENNTGSGSILQY